MRYPEKENPTYGEVVRQGSETLTILVYENYFQVGDTLYKGHPSIAGTLEDKYFD